MWQVMPSLDATEWLRCVIEPCAPQLPGGRRRIEGPPTWRRNHLRGMFRKPYKHSSEHPHSSKAFPLVWQHSVNGFLNFHLVLKHPVILCTPGRFCHKHPLCFQVVRPASRVNLHLVRLEVSICPAPHGQTTKAIAQCPGSSLPKVTRLP